MNIQQFIVHLSLIENVGPACINRILEQLPTTSFHDLYTFSIIDFMHRYGFKESSAQRLVEGLRDTKNLEQELAHVQKNGVEIITILDEIYPSVLRTMHLPPAVLYIKGAPLADHKESIAFVGARHATDYGKMCVDALVPPLVDHGISIVSGGARGVDTFAHQAALEHKGKTVVVLGSGFNFLYPTSNIRLFSTIIESGGTIVTSYPMNMEPLPGNFPARNRIIAGLSKACVVVQAAQKSGSLITASCALEQGKEVFAVPGVFNDPLSAGCHALLRQGAHVVTSAADILRECGYIAEHNMNIFTQETKERVPMQENAEETSLVTLCKYPISIDELEQKTGLSLLELQTQLFDLQLCGKVTQNFMGMWQRS